VASLAELFPPRADLVKPYISESTQKLHLPLFQKIETALALHFRLDENAMPSFAATRPKKYPIRIQQIWRINLRKRMNQEGVRLPAKCDNFPRSAFDRFRVSIFCGEKHRRSGKPLSYPKKLFLSNLVGLTFNPASNGAMLNQRELRVNADPTGQ